MENCEKVVEKLEAKIQKYEKIIEQIMENPKMLGTIEAGPEKADGKDYYRVKGGGASALITYDESMLFKKGKEILKPGTEVVILNGKILGVLPDKLFEVKEQNEFELISWDKIGGLRSQVNAIREAVELPLNNAKLFKEFGLKPSKGILLWGPPGCGKTLVAKAIASVVLKDSKADDESFVYVKGAELLSMWVGKAEESIRYLFKNARKYGKRSGKRAVIFIDEAEAILPVRGSMRSSDVDRTIVPTFLSEMDGFESNSPLMILSTNLPNQLDPAIVRDGRIDLKVQITRPNPEDAKEIFEIHLKSVLCADRIQDLAHYGTESIFGCDMVKQVSGAMIENVVKTAAHKALTRKLNNPKVKSGIILEDLQNVFEYETEPA
jgi:SpoVK/Ycf46/Vps4 family AAA+-type ATPase